MNEQDPVNRKATRQTRSWKKATLVGALAFGLQGGILAIALLIGVLDPKPPQQARLKLSEGSPTRQREQRKQVNVQLAQLNRLQKGVLQKLANPILQSTLPDVAVPRPDLAASMQVMGAMLPMESMFADTMSAFATSSDADALPPPDPVEFLGENLAAKRIVLLLDVSASVKSKLERAGVSMDQLRSEVLKFIDQLGPNHLFGIIQFTRNWQAFRDQLLPATKGVQAEAREWINSRFRTTGTSGSNWTRGSPNGIEGVLSTAFGMDPALDEIVLLCDGDFQRTPPGGGGQDVPWEQLRQLTRSLQEQSIGTARLRVLCYYPPEDALADLRAWVLENDKGTLRIVSR